MKTIIIGLITGLANGLFGSGGGTIAVPAMTMLLDAEDHEAHATAISIILPLTFLSAFYYVSNNFVDWGITWRVTVGGMIGGFIGAKLLHVCPSKVLRKIFGVIMVVAAIRLLIK